MRIIDLTMPVVAATGQDRFESLTVETRDKIIRSGSSRPSYTGAIHVFTLGSMAGTYVDFPGHIRETDDGRCAAGMPAERFYRLDAAVVRFDRGSGSGGVTAAEFAGATGGRPPAPALVVNALGHRRHDEIDNRSVYLAPDAVQWIVDRGVRLLVSDIYESKALHGVFPAMFRAGISTVCCPVRLHEVPLDGVKITMLVPPLAGAVQVPCRVLAECG